MSKIENRQFTGDEVERIVRNYLTDEFGEPSFVTIDEDGTCLPERFVNFAECIQKLEVRNDDVWVCSFPKTGTTWTQEMVWLIGNNLDYEGAKTVLDQRFPFLEVCSLFDFEKTEKILGVKSPECAFNSIEFIKSHANPRFIKTHLPFPLLPQEIQNGSKSPKIIYVVRNPKDACVSFFHHSKLLRRCKTDLENFAKAFLADKVMYGPFWKHVMGFWRNKDLQNLLIITYEDMTKDLPAVIKRVAAFLGKTLTEEQIQQLAEHLSFDSMKKNQAVNYEHLTKLRRQKNLATDGDFLRSGKAGKYKEELSAGTIAKFNEWIRKNVDGTSFGQEYSFDL